MAGDKLKKKLTVSPEITGIWATEDNKIEIKWTKVPLAEKYAVKRAASPEDEFEIVSWTKRTGFVDETVEDDRVYWYEIVACKAIEGNKLSKKRSEQTVIKSYHIPCAEELSSTAENGNIYLTWSSDSGDKYRIYRRCDFYSKRLLVGECDGNSFTDTAAIPGQRYHYSIRTVKADEDGEFCSNFSAETDCAFLNTTEILSVKATLGNKAVLGVRVIAGADGYIFERSDRKDGEFVEVGRTEDITAVDFEEKLPSRVKNYYYRACAYKKSGETEYRGSYSPVKSVR